MGGKRTLAHFGSAWAFSSVLQYRNAVGLHSSMNSGLFFFAEMKRMISSLRPLGARSSPISVTKPHLYSCCASSRIASVFELIGFPQTQSWSQACHAHL